MFSSDPPGTGARMTVRPPGAHRDHELLPFPRKVSFRSGAARGVSGSNRRGANGRIEVRGPAGAGCLREGARSYGKVEHVLPARTFAP